MEALFQQRSYNGGEDIRAMQALANASPAHFIHRADLPYRLSSWALDDPANASLWFDESGALAAWAVIQPPFWAFDIAIRPECEVDLRLAVLRWAEARAARLDGTPFGRPLWFLNLFADDDTAIRLVEEAGYADQSDKGEDSWLKVFLSRLGHMPIPASALPAGFAIRPLAGADEAQAYVDLHRAVFESKNMTLGWRLNTLRHPDYLLELDLVLEAPGGELAGFCIGWLNRHEPDGVPTGQIEPMGISSQYRGQGLGRALLDEALRRLVERGAQAIYVETDNYRDAAYGLYHAAGFEKIRDILVFRKQDEPQT